MVSVPGHAKAASASRTGRQHSTVSSVIRSRPDLIASTASSLKRRNTRAVSPSVTDPAQGTGAEHAGLAQGEVAQDGRDKRLELSIGRPPLQHKLIEAPGKLHIAADRLARVRDPEAYQR